jgi:hypothetical protein
VSCFNFPLQSFENKSKILSPSLHGILPFRRILKPWALLLNPAVLRLRSSPAHARLMPEIKAAL